MSCKISSRHLQDVFEDVKLLRRRRVEDVLHLLKNSWEQPIAANIKNSMSISDCELPYKYEEREKFCKGIQNVNSRKATLQGDIR